MNRRIPWAAVSLLVMLSTTLRAAPLNEEPWLELKHLSETPRPHYEPFETQSGETLYAAEAAIVDPICIADIVPAEDGSSITVTLTTAGRKRLLQFTEDHIGEKLGLFLDGEMIKGPLLINEAFAGITLGDDFPSAVRMRLVEAWAAPIHVREGKREVRVAGLGVIEVDIRHASAFAVQFLHEGSLYRFPVAFLSRPELPGPDSAVLRVKVTPRGIRADGSDLGTPTQALAYIKKMASEDQFVLLECNKQELDQLSDDEVAKFTPLFSYAYEHPSFVGLRQEMPKDWKWSSR